MNYLDYNFAKEEAYRCLMCEDAPCWHSCPAAVNPRKFVRKIRFDSLAEAARELRRANVLAGCCSYICPCGRTCVGNCTSEKLSRPIDIIGLQKFVCEWEISSGMIEPKKTDGGKGKVAIVGSGPAGLACAAELAVFGCQPVVFDSAPNAGGMLRSVIPEFRLPTRVLDFEIEFIKKLGVEFVMKTKIDDLSKLFDEGFKVVFVSTGACESKRTGIIGEDKKGVCEALEFLKGAKLNLDNCGSLNGKRVVVVGGGDTAVDSARTAARAGALVTLLYRRTRLDMPAYRPDIEEAEKEGVEFVFRTMPRSIIGSEGVVGVKAAKIRWKGKGRQAEGYDVEGTEFTLPCDIVIMAAGQVSAGDFGLRTAPNGYIAVDKNMMTSGKGIFAGGDIVSGPSTAVAAVGSGKLAAEKICIQLGVAGFSLR